MARPEPTSAANDSFAIDPETRTKDDNLDNMARALMAKCWPMRLWKSEPIWNSQAFSFLNTEVLAEKSAACKQILAHTSACGLRTRDGPGRLPRGPNRDAIWTRGRVW